MKPTVIANSGSGTSGNTSQTPGGHHINNNNPINPQNDGNNNPNRQEFPNFQGFGFDPDMDEMFSDTGIRSRLGRMPFGFGSRKRVNDPNRYFDDDNDFFSNFGSLGRRRSQPQAERTGVFDHIPPEFRQYMPDTFDFPHHTMRNTPSSPRSAGTQQQHPPQYYEAYAQPGPGSPTANQPQAQKPKLCDAAIQTECPTDETDQPNKPHKTQPLKQHGLRNTVDLGQKSPPENESSPRAQSAPPRDPSEQDFTNSSASAATFTSNPNNTHASATAYAYVPPPEQQRWQPQPQQSSPPHSQQRPQIPHPPPRSQPQQPYYQSTAQIPQPQPQSQSSSQNQGSAYVRTVPIFVEGRSAPVINEQGHIPSESQPSGQHQQHQASPQYQQQQKQFRPQQQEQPPQPQSQQQYQPYHQYQTHQQHQPQARPTPLNTQQANAAPTQQSPVPSTPQTTETIEKIQSIQRDVLDLMSKVEKFTGVKSDKEYMYLDEMLTRNLLKLDTIDTQGKERIRLARKEAIKCIQASINVLEAKAEGNAKTAQKAVMNVHEMSTNTEPEQNTANNESTNNPDPAPVIIDEASTAKLPDVVPLPPPPERPVKENQQPENKESKSEQTNQETTKQSADPIKEDTKQAEEQNPNEINKDEATTNLEQIKDESVTPPDDVPSSTSSADQENKKEEKQQSPTKEERSKESPRKKIVKKIIKKLEKKDKKGSATPPSTEQETSEPPPVTEVTN